MTPDARLHPFTLVFGELAEERFPAISDALGADHSIAAFMLSVPALELMGLLRPDEGLGDAVDDFVAFVHAAWRYWADGQQQLTFDEAATRQLCHAEAGAPPAASPPGDGATRYIQLYPRLVWGRLASDETYEPLDGWFATRHDDTLRAVACFGLHSARPGLSVVVAEGARPTGLVREDRSPIFSPMMPGGDIAGLFAVAAPEELLLLAWRAGEGEVPGR